MGTLKDSDAELLSLFEEGIDNRQREERHNIPALPTALNGLSILFHIEQHIRTEIGPRQLIDWMMYVEKNVEDDFWTQHLSSLLERAGRKTFAIALTAMCQEYLGLRRDIKWVHPIDSDVCAELIAYVMSRGNFGNKIDKDDQIASFWITAKTPETFFRRLQKEAFCVGWWQIKTKFSIRLSGFIKSYSFLVSL